MRSHFAKSLFIVVCALCYARIFFGVDTIDEGSHVAYSYSLARGRKPLLEERDIRQTTAWVLSPVVTPFVRLIGTDYLVLYMRHISFFVALLVSVFLLTIKGSWSLTSRLLAATLVMAFVPYSILSFSYLRHSFLFLSVGIFLWWRALRSSKPLCGVLLAQVCFVVTSVLYPTQVVTCFLMNVFGIFLRRKQGKRIIQEVCGIGIFWVLTLGLAQIWLSGHGGWKILTEVVQYHRSIGHGGAGWKILEILAGFRFYGRFFVCAALGMLALYLSSKKQKIWIVLLPLFLIAPFFQGWNNVLGAIPTLWIIVLALLYVIKGIRDDLWKLLAIPSLIGGIISAWTSSSPLSSLAYGLFPAALAWFLTSHEVDSKFRGHFSTVTLNLMVLGIMLYCQGAFIPQDDRYRYLTERFSKGPFAGIYTSKNVYDFLRGFGHDVRMLPRDSIIIYPNFPAGYLYSDSAPRTPSTCLLNGAFVRDGLAYDEYTANYFSKDFELPKYVIKMLQVPWQSGRLEAQQYPTHSLERRLGLAKDYRLINSRSDYKIWEKITG